MLEALYLCACLSLGVSQPPPMPSIVYLERPRPHWRHGRASYDMRTRTVYVVDRSVIAHELAHAAQHARDRHLGMLFRSPEAQAAYEAEAERIADKCLRQTRL